MEADLSLPFSSDDARHALRNVETERTEGEPVAASGDPAAKAVAVPSRGRRGEVSEMDAERPKLRRPSQARARSRGSTSLYERMGGAVALRRLIRRFHELMETLPEAEAARAVLHVAPADLGPKLYEFLSGWLGGPDLYAKRHGAPKLKRRHFLVPIGPAQRDGWLLCFRIAAQETITDTSVVAELLPQVESLAHYLANRD